MSVETENHAPRQRVLDLPWPRRDGMTRADWIASGASAESCALVEGWRDWPGGRLALCGPEGAGKSHLATIWAREAGARFLPARALSACDAAAAAAHGRLVLEDFPESWAAAGPERRADLERGLFHLINLIAAQGGRLLLTGRAPPARWPAALPDLASRLEATALARLAPPDDALLGALILKLFEDRGLRPHPRVAAYMAARLERSGAAVLAAVERLDARALETGAPITIHNVKEWFRW